MKSLLSSQVILSEVISICMSYCYFIDLIMLELGSYPIDTRVKLPQHEADHSHPSNVNYFYTISHDVVVRYSNKFMFVSFPNKNGRQIRFT